MADCTLAGVRRRVGLGCQHPVRVQLRVEPCARLVLCGLRDPDSQLGPIYGELYCFVELREARPPILHLPHDRLPLLRLEQRRPVHAADQDKQHASAAFTQSEFDNATKDRARLESQIEEADKAADRKPVGKLEAELQLAKDKANTTWESYTTRRGRKTATITARPQRFKDEVTKAEGRLKSARDRDAKQSELKLLPSVEATPAAADSGVETVKTVLDWFGIHNLSKETYSRILALWDTGLMQLLCLVGPHGMFFFLFGALAPDAAHRRRLQEATEKAANKATREATRTVKNAMWGRWRENAAAAIKARFTRKKPPVYVPEPEAAPEPERRFEDEFGEDMRDVVEGLEVAPEPAAKPAPKAQEWHECRDFRDRGNRKLKVAKGGGEAVRH